MPREEARHLGLRGFDAGINLGISGHARDAFLGIIDDHHRNVTDLCVIDGMGAGEGVDFAVIKAAEHGDERHDARLIRSLDARGHRLIPRRPIAHSKIERRVKNIGVKPAIKHIEHGLIDRLRKGVDALNEIACVLLLPSRHQLIQERIARSEIPIKRRAGAVHALGQCGNAHLVDTLLDENLIGRIKPERHAVILRNLHGMIDVGFCCHVLDIGSVVVVVKSLDIAVN